ncbi:hypothetical protein LLEC1_06051 [Akanthomyces lecanii]|uniref:CS domain-containing protein n=1 Tax=Cordyceps confragosa TaxID=2714763 RepID=A0A179I7U9_CORDF|nr:hypothetical protein LLEC1_06051 [Akanthomyces lecanii]
MSHITLAQQGLAAAEARDWDGAITKLSKALQSSQNPAWLLARSKALVNLHRYDEALDDANLAWHTAYDRNKRPLMIDANYRRAVAYFRQGKLADADACCLYAMRLIKGAPAILTAMEKLPADDPARTATVPAKPEEKKLADLSSTVEETKPAASSTTTTTTATPTTTQVPAAKPVVSSDTPLRLQEFQTTTTMSVSIFSKGVNKEKLKVDFQPSSVHLNSVIYPSGDERAFQLDLWGEIDTTVSKYTVTPNKVELTLVKKTSGKWAQLKSDGKPKQPAAPIATPAAPAAATEAATTSDAKPAAASTAGPAYPSSSRTGPKNWDQLDVGEDGKDDDEGNDINFFFKKMYKGATPEQQRAMMKSFTESNGTSLSTDWNDVKDRKVETVPPEGVQARKWE